MQPLEWVYYYIRYSKIVEGIKMHCDLNRNMCRISEVSLRIRFPIHRAVFGVDFFMLLNPNLKKLFIYIGSVFNCIKTLVTQT